MGKLLFRPVEQRLRRILIESTFIDKEQVLKDNASNDVISWLIIFVMNKLRVPCPTNNVLNIANYMWQ